MAWLVLWKFDSNKRIIWKFIYYILDNKNIVDTTKTLVTIRRKRLIDEMKTLYRETDLLLAEKLIKYEFYSLFNNSEKDMEIYLIEKIVC